MNARIKLQMLQEKLESSFDYQLKEEIQVQQRELFQLVEAEVDYLRSQARATWCSSVGRNTRYFCVYIKSSRRSLKVSCLTRDDGTIINAPDAIAVQFLYFYQNLLGTANLARESLSEGVINMGPKLDLSMRESLEVAYSADEVKQDIFSMDDEKSPGPDGFSAHFYKRAWSTVGADITQAILDFFGNGDLLYEINSTVISLVPKVPLASRVNDFRPISC